VATENHLVQPGLQAARNRAEAWRAHQAERLGVSPDAITATVKRGWLPNEIDGAKSPAELLGPPPDRDVFGLKVVRGG
jgi:hypothetical protein